MSILNLFCCGTEAHFLSSRVGQTFSLKGQINTLGCVPMTLFMDTHLTFIYSFVTDDYSFDFLKRILKCKNRS